MLATESVGAVLKDLRSRVDGIGAALVSRNGHVLYSDLPEGVSSETFAIMCATVFGAAATASSELGRAGPDRITIEGPDSKSVLVGCGDTALLTVVVGSSADPETVLRETMKFAGLLNGR